MIFSEFLNSSSNMKNCVICKTRYKIGSKTKFHRFPADCTQRSKWLENMKNFNWTPKEHYLCSKHFDDKCFNKYHNKTTLKPGSVPTIFEDPNSCEEFKIRDCDCENEPRGKRKDVEELPLLPDTNLSVKQEITDCENVSGRKKRDVEELALLPDPNSCVTLEINDCENVSEKKETDVEELPDPLEKAHCKNVSGSKAINVEEPQPKVLIYPFKYAISTSPTFESSLSCRQSLKQHGIQSSETVLIDDDEFQKDASTSTDELERDRLLQDSVRNDHYYGAPLSPKKSTFGNSVAHDHQYEMSPTSYKNALQRTKRSLQLSNARVTALTRHIKILNNKVAKLKTVINNQKCR